MRFARPMRWPDTSEAACFCLDHLAKGVVAECSLLLKMQTDFRDFIRGNGFVQMLSPGERPGFWRSSESKPRCMRLDEGVGNLAQVRRAAGPGPRSRIVGQMGTDRVQFDVAMTA
jgi:hypothetical protein